VGTDGTVGLGSGGGETEGTVTDGTVTVGTGGTGTEGVDTVGPDTWGTAEVPTEARASGSAATISQARHVSVNPARTRRLGHRGAVRG
jgi:hypothetical protein